MKNNGKLFVHEHAYWFYYDEFIVSACPSPDRIRDIVVTVDLFEFVVVILIIVFIN